VVTVKKANGKWRMCTDYTDLNKACPKDPFPLPCIDKLVDNSAGYKYLSFMDAYSGYNQIPMQPEDQEKTTFITDMGVYCYVDGSSKTILIENNEGVTVEYSLKFEFPTSNNQVEYEACLAGIRTAKELGASGIPNKRGIPS
jgi:hypothetical protein